MSSIIIGGILAIFASQGFWTWITSRQNKKTIENDAMHNMILALGRKSLLQCSKKYKAEGSIPADEYEAYTQMYNAYIEMGGNGTIAKYHEEVVKLPIDDK